MELKLTPQQKYYESNKEQMKAYMRNYYNNKCSNDNEFKEKERERVNKQHKNKYHTDPEYKEKVNAKRRELYYKKKAEKQTNTLIVSIEVTA